MADPIESACVRRTRRTILTGAAAATVASIVAGRRADAAPGQPVLQGRVNNAGATSTSLNSSASTSTLRVANTAGHGSAATTSNRNFFGLAGSNTATIGGTGGAISANGGRNHGVIASTAAVIKYGLLARNTGATSDAGAAIRAEGNRNDGVLGFANAMERVGVVGIDLTSATTNVGWGVVSVGDAGIDGDLFGSGNADFQGTVTAANIPATGSVTLDESGTAGVPALDARARDVEYHYQLTAVGDAMPNLHVVEGAGGSFMIAGGKPGGRVSWQRTKRALASAPTVQSAPAKVRRDFSAYLTR